MKKHTILIGTAVLIGAAFTYFGFTGPEPSPTGTAMANVLVPELSATAQDGEALFVRSCADCHGTERSRAGWNRPATGSQDL
jgi:mono/diheme cytochrome c family protein